MAAARPFGPDPITIASTASATRLPGPFGRYFTGGFLTRDTSSTARIIAPVTAVAAYPSSPNRAERTIAVARVLMASLSLFAIWLDPAEPARYVQVTYTLHWLYVAYSIALAAIVWTRSQLDRLRFVSHVADIVVFSVLQYLTLGPSSPFFVYFVFSMFCGALRWGWRGTLATAGAVMMSYMTMGATMHRTLGPAEFELNIIRLVYLVMSAMFLVYLGRYEERLRTDIERLARWPATIDGEPNHVIVRVLAHACHIVDARQAVMVWEAGEEPVLRIATWSIEGSSVSTCSPDEMQPLVGPDFERATLICHGKVASESAVMVSRNRGELTPCPTPGLHPGLVARLSGHGLASSPFATGRVSGRVFFTDLGTPTAEIVPLTDVVARQIGASLDELHATEHLKAVAAGEERIRLARDLHDGVLQCPTGIRRGLGAVAAQLNGNPSAPERLFAIERALAIEQRELRLFIDGVGPAIRRDKTQRTLSERLHALRERIALEWKTPVNIRVTLDAAMLPDQVEQAIPPMVHEAIVNALKHADPSRVAVTIDGGLTDVRIIVTDDGRGFPFRGRYDHAALMANDAGPRSLLDRVESLGGRMSIDSSDAGSRVEMRLSV